MPSVAWTTSGKLTPESYNPVLVRANTEVAALAADMRSDRRSVLVSIPKTVPDGTFRLRLYAMSPRALTGVNDPWVSWADSDGLVLKGP